MTGAAALLLGFLLDGLFGDPESMPHPVRIMGAGITFYEKRFRKGGSRRGDFVSGTVLALLLLALAFCVPFFLLRMLYGVHTALGLGVEAVICYQALAARDLARQSMNVRRALDAGDLPGARRAVSRIVGRDTESLTAEEVSKAAIETVAENLTDGVIAPILFMLAGGAPAGLLYKAINTMDSMIGYRDERYEYFGKFAARLDDVANFIPARVAAFFLLLSAALWGHDARGAARVYRRDRRRHKSPNSAHTESVCAGALGIALSGDSRYRGVLVQKPVIGDPLRPVTPEDIRTVNRLMYTASVLALLLGVAVRLLAAWVIF